MDKSHLKAMSSDDVFLSIFLPAVAVLWSPNMDKLEECNSESGVSLTKPSYAVGIVIDLDGELIGGTDWDASPKSSSSVTGTD